MRMGTCGCTSPSRVSLVVRLGRSANSSNGHAHTHHPGPPQGNHLIVALAAVADGCVDGFGGLHGAPVGLEQADVVAGVWGTPEEVGRRRLLRGESSGVAGRRQRGSRRGYQTVGGDVGRAALRGRQAGAGTKWEGRGRIRCISACLSSSRDGTETTCHERAKRYPAPAARARAV